MDPARDNIYEIEEIREILMLLLTFLFLHSTNRTPCRTSSLSGHAYTLELMNTPSDSRFRDVARMGQASFVKLIDTISRVGGLRSSPSVSLQEKVLIFVAMLKGQSNRDISERWQHSGSTTSSIIHDVANALLRLKGMYIKQSDGSVISAKIVNNPKYYPFFENCIGALDGTHIHAIVPPEMSSRFRNRKGFISQNVLGVVDFNMMFTFILAGWEGSAHDGKVLASAIDHGLSILQGKYYLGDAGYPLKECVLTPYRGVRYHLKEFGRGSQRPRNKEELFNYRHAQLRNVIERTYGVIKKRFPVLVKMNSFSIEFQVKIVVCAAILHNFIRLNESEDYFYNDIDTEVNNDEYDDNEIRRIDGNSA